MMVPRREVARNTTVRVGPSIDDTKSQDISSRKVQLEMEPSANRNTTISMVREGQEDVSVTLSSVPGNCYNALDKGHNPLNAQECSLNEMANCKDKVVMHSSPVESQNVDGQKKVQFAVGDNTTAQGNLSSIFHGTFTFRFLTPCM